MTNPTPEYNSPFGLEKEMGYSRKEFFGSLERCLSGYDYVVNNEKVSIKLEEGSITIHIGQEGKRIFTQNVQFPILPVQIEFTGATEYERSQFLQKFDHTYMKGLG
ncbi:MAG: hypothetical protein KTR32_25595 [Granulosicoccus sp.]|nr:hypothetical protein [Granulosicoccus sp.]